MKKGPFTFTIGRGSWAEEIRYYTAEIAPNYWSDFRVLSLEEVAGIEREVQRRLPEDFKEFLRTFGYGRFPKPYHGNIYGPEEFVHGCHGHLFLILDSSRWASRDEQRQFYVTRGGYNPAPNEYTRESLLFNRIDLLDLLQIGTNGMCCYHQVYVGEKPGPFGYCLLTPERTAEDQTPSFSEGLKTILTHHWFWNEPSDEDLPGLPPFLEPD
jgi:hypothetical protein